MGFFDSGISEGLNQVSGQMLNTGMQVARFKQDQLVQDQTMRLRQEAAEREKIAFDRNEKAIKEKETRDNTVVPASKYFPKIRQFPSYRQSLKEGFEALNLPYQETPDGDILGKYGHGQEVLQWIYAKGERAEKQARGVYADLQTQKMAILEQLQTVKKPEEAKTLNDKLEALSLQQGEVLGSTWEMGKKMAEEKAKEERQVAVEQVKQEGKDDDLIAVGHTVFDKKTRKPIYTAPSATSNTESKRDAREAKKEQLKIYDDAIKDYDHNIQFAKGQLKAAQDYDEENPGSTKYKEMTDSLNENQKQRDITAQRRRDYLSGKQSKQATGAYKTANDVKAAFKAGKIKEAEAVKILKDKFGMK